MFEIVGIDIGYGNCKIVNKYGKKICFPSLAKKGTKLDIHKSLGAIKDYVATINGTTWYIGEMASKENRFAIRAFDDAERFTNSAFQAMLATCLAVSIEKDSRILMVTGLPLSAYQTSRKVFQEFLSSFTAEVEINGDVRTVKVEEAYVFPQAAGVFLNPFCRQIRQKGMIPSGSLATVIDIGFRTTDIAVFEYDDEQPSLLTERSFTIDEGMISIFRELGNRICSDIKTFDVSLERAEQVFLTGTLIGLDHKMIDYRPVINGFAEKVVGSISESLKLNGPDKARDNIMLLAGGGSIALKNQLAEVFPNAIQIPDAQYANALGFLDVGKRLDFKILN